MPHAHATHVRRARFGEWSAREVEFLNTVQLLTAKPVVYLVNLSAKAYAKKKSKFLPKLFEWVQARARACVCRVCVPRVYVPRVYVCARATSCINTPIVLCVGTRMLTHARSHTRAHSCTLTRSHATVVTRAQAHGGDPIVPFSGELESKIFDMPDDEKAAYLKEARAWGGLLFLVSMAASGARLRLGCWLRGPQPTADGCDRCPLAQNQPIQTNPPPPPARGVPRRWRRSPRCQR